MLKKPGILFVSLLFAAVFLFGLARLFALRFERGDVYPPYSTLRTDPLGVSVFYEGIRRLPGLSAERLFEESFRNEDGHHSTFFVLGGAPYEFTGLGRGEFDALQRFIVSGGRVVISFAPEPRKAKAWHQEEEAKTNSVPATNHPPALKGSGKSSDHPGKVEPKDKKTDDSDENESKAALRHMTNLTSAWEYDVAYKNIPTNDLGALEFPMARRVGVAGGLPLSLPIHSAVCFSNVAGWHVIYQRDPQDPVVIERKFGAGSVVLMADAYPFSNEAMVKELSAPLLAWLLGSGRKALFDESHFGIMESESVVMLMRRYQLEGLMVSVLVVAGLFVWKNGRSLVPPYADADSSAGPIIAGRDAASGFINLVRRGISPAEIINVCFGEWKKSSGQGAGVSPAQRRDLNVLMEAYAATPSSQRTPVETYRAASRILRRRKHS
jgi:hypothetical protein